jgi:16S rRNA (cytidine1402-2'-O)-methyltransferase
MSTLYVVATPIGNLQDISERAKTTLASVDVVLCEDTRVTKKLLDAYGISVKTVSYHQHSAQSKTSEIYNLLEEGKNLALVTDAGTPSISDPGGRLVEELVNHFGDQLKIVPIPGPSAIISALSVSGFPADEFLFLGFPPNKKGRQTYFDRVAKIESTIVFYESTHRIFKTLDEIHARCPDRLIMVGRELTKMYESVYRGTASQVTEQLKLTSIKGEFVIVIRSL